MKKFILLFCLGLISLNGFSQTKTGTIDAEYILKQLPGFATVDEGLKAYNEELQKQLEEDVKRYETLVKDYQAKNPTYTEEEKKKKETEIIALENDIKGFRQKATLMMQMKRNQLTKPLYEKINQAMLKVIEEENFTHVLHAGSSNLAFAAAAFDITEKVLKKMGITPKEEPAVK